MTKAKKLAIQRPLTALLVVIVVLLGAGVFAFGEHRALAKLASGTQLEASRKTIIRQFLLASSINCTDSADKTSPTDRVYVFFEYLRINKYDNRAVIRGCNNQDSLLMKTKVGQWTQTRVNVSLDARANPAWQKTCLIDDITVADIVLRPQNHGIDSQNLKECRYMQQNNIDIPYNQLIKVDN